MQFAICKYAICKYAIYDWKFQNSSFGLTCFAKPRLTSTLIFVVFVLK